jgi:hypothetical protein
MYKVCQWLVTGQCFSAGALILLHQYIVYTFDYLFMDRSYAYKFKWLIDNYYIVALYVIVSK